MEFKQKRTRRTKIDLAKKHITKFFSKPNAIYKRKDIHETLRTNRYKWSLAESTQVDDFIKTLINWEVLIEHKVEFDDSYPSKKIYSTPGTDERLVMLSLYPNQYLAYYTALAYHNLTEQLPTNIYLSHETNKGSLGKIEDQSAIDKAFEKPPRITSKKVVKGDRTYVFTEANYSKKLGVIKVEFDLDISVLVTNIERTLIDAMIKPEYCGGVWEVLSAFEAAGKRASVNRMMAYLTKLNYIYPYHQRLGFYLERSGAYEVTQIEQVARKDIEWAFYLAHGLKDLLFDDKWQVYYPKGM